MMLEFECQRMDRTGEKTYWYRYEPTQYSAGFDLDGDLLPGPGALGVSLTRYEVLRETPTGVWVLASTYDRPEPHEKFQARHWRKKLCHPTKEEAWEALRQRKLRQIAILSAQIRTAKVVAQVIKDSDGPPEDEHRFQVEGWKQSSLVNRFDGKEPLGFP